MPVSSTSAPPAGKPKPSVRTQILRPLLIVAALVAVLMVWGVVSEHQSQQRSHAAYCQQFGGNDPAC